MTIKEAIDFLKSYDLEDHCAIHLWTESDVIDVAQLEGTSVTTEDAQEILDDVHGHINNENGVTWKTIRCYVQDFVRDRDRDDISPLL